MQKRLQKRRQQIFAKIRCTICKEEIKIGEMYYNRRGYEQHQKCADLKEHI